MKTKTQILFSTVAAALLTVSLGCEPPKPPAPDNGAGVTAAGDNTTGTSNMTGSSNMTGNTTAGSETPVGETP